jgi:hypothetical protein
MRVDCTAVGSAAHLAQPNNSNSTTDSTRSQLRVLGLHPLQAVPDRWVQGTCRQVAASHQALAWVPLLLVCLRRPRQQQQTR